MQCLAFSGIESGQNLGYFTSARETVVYMDQENKHNEETGFPGQIQREIHNMKKIALAKDSKI